MANSRSSRRAQRAQAEQRRKRTRFALIAALALVLAGAVLTLALGGNGDKIDAGTSEIKVDMFEFGFSGEMTAPSGPIRLTATNTGRIPHNIGVRRGPISNEVDPGGSVSLDLGEVGPGIYELYCDIVGHAEAGMVAPLTITAAPTTAPSTTP